MAKKHTDEDPQAMQAFVKMMTDHQWAIRGFILSLMPGSPDVGDVLQETNLVLWRKQKSFEPGTNFLGWACQCARFEVLRHRDRVRRHTHLPFSDELVNVLAERQGVGASQEQRLVALENCMEKLSPKQRLLVEQRYTPGLTLESHAATLGTTAASLRVTLHRVRRALKRCVEQSLATSQP